MSSCESLFEKSVASPLRQPASQQQYAALRGTVGKWDGAATETRGYAHSQTGVELIAFKPEHLAAITPAVLSEAQLSDFVHHYRPRGPAFSLRRRAGVLGCAGLLLEGCKAQAWAVLSDSLRTEPFLLHRCVVHMLPALQQTYALQSIEASAPIGFCAAERWLLRLGFTRAGLLPGYLGTTETYVRYVRR